MMASKGIATEANGLDAASIARELIAKGRIPTWIDELAREAAYRSYSKDGMPNCQRIAANALDAFFATGSPEMAEDVVRYAKDIPLSLACEMEQIRSSGSYRALVAIVRQGIVSTVTGMDHDRAFAYADRVVSNAVERKLTDLDHGVPLDLIDDEEVVVCYVPGLTDIPMPNDGLDNGIGLTSFRGFGSNCLTIEPDEAFARFLKLVNVSSDEYVRLVRELRGADLRETSGSWADFEVECDPGRDKLLEGEQLLDAIDGALYGFHPLLAFKAPARFLIDRDWSTPLSVKGGIVGLHNFKNGSGDPRRFEGTFTVTSSPRSFIVGEGRRCDFEEAYGFIASAFESRVCDGQPVTANTPLPR